MSERFRPTWVEVDLDAIRANVRELKPAGSDLMAVVKANAYGHGDVEVAAAVVEAGAAWLGVALVEEGVRLRRAGITAPVLVLSELPPGAEAPALEAGLTPTLYTDGGLERLAAAASGRTIAVHVKVDTGMHRVGVYPPGATAGFLDRIAARGLHIQGLFTHLARSEEADDPTTREQLDRFREVVERSAEAGHEPALIHAANTGALLRHPGSHLDLVRSGIGIYGLEPGPDTIDGRGLRAALSWRSRVAMVKRLPAGTPTSYGHQYRLAQDAWVATVPVGYADGYSRRLSSRADVLIRGQRCRVAGGVTMDQLIVDCGDLPVDAGDDVVLLGSQGDETVSAEELGRHAGTINYEIVTRIGPRVPREYRG